MPWFREHPRLIDGLIAAGVFVYMVPFLPLYADDALRLIVMLLVSIVLCFSYLWRRRFPLPVLAVMLVAACVPFLLDADNALIVADAMLVLSVYNVASRYRWPVSVPAAAAVICWLVVAVQDLLRLKWVNIGDVGVLVVVIAWVWTWGTLARVRRAYIEGLRERTAQLEREQAALAQVVAATERARIAREMHDVVSHGLTEVVVLADAAASTVDADPAQAQTVMWRVRDTGRSALAEMRRMLDVLRDDEPGSHAPQPGIDRLPDLIGQARETGLPVDLTVEGTAVSLPAGVDLAVFRVVQEALTNVRKHAGTVCQVDVRLDYGDDAVTVTVSDDGTGTPDADDVPGGGHGLVGMTERAAAYGGTVQAGPRPAGGFTVSVRLPIGGES